MKLSIIIPIYNTADYLDQCLGSIVHQLTDEMEVILVNDGSTDHSASICEVYVSQYPQIKLIHQENMGQSEARNTGIRQAQGDYLLFVDSDDYIADQVLQPLLASVKDEDLIFLEAVKVYPDGRLVSLGEGYEASRIINQPAKVVLEALAQLPKFPGSPWNKLIRREFLLANQLFFVKGLYSEDVDWALSLLLYAKHFGYYPEVYYYYRQDRDTSITQNIGPKNIASLLMILEKWTANLATNPYRSAYQSFLAYEYVITLFCFAYLNRAEQAPLVEKLDRYRFLLNYRPGVAYRVLSLFSGIFGSSRTASLLSFYQKYRLKWSKL